MSISKSWRIPSNWQDFEELCEQLLEREYRPCSAHRYGRAGQDQHGVDITVLLEGDKKPIGVQCKLRSELTGRQLKDTDINEIYQTSLKYSQGLKSLKIATTCPYDKSATDMCAQISESWQKKYPIELLFWPDIEALLTKHEDVACRFYPEAFSPERLLQFDRLGHIQISLPQFNWESGLKELFKRKEFQSMAGTDLEALKTILSELTANTLDPGKGTATVARITVRSNKIIFEDNGKIFNSLTASLPKRSNQHGLRTIRKLHEESGRLAWEYTPHNPKLTRFNTTHITAMAPLASIPETCRSALELEYVISRDEARRFVSRLAIPPECDSYTVCLALNGVRVVSASAADEILEQLVKVIDGRPLTLEVEPSTVASELEEWVCRHQNVSIRWVQ
ncbi:restriction endonuclease [Comamonas sp. NyZ500]|uniref:restriction endonuclease n=1 Tax=Comamonas sp. NyZ500 TaxID=2795732 RepID=UPI00192CAF8A|nr:restriction endonuclease [Comamonas sp. NyZ500]MBL5979385.1 restriction endonuclease [Comamonas sp. NyZ500]